jgi:hypothetical protein
MRRSRFIVFSIAVLTPLALATLLFEPLLESRRLQSPDGAFTALFRTQPYRMFVSVMPGQGWGHAGSHHRLQGIALVRISMGRSWLDGARPGLATR